MGLLPNPFIWWTEVLFKVTSSSAPEAPGSPSISWFPWPVHAGNRYPEWRYIAARLPEAHFIASGILQENFKQVYAFQSLSTHYDL